MGRRSVTVGVVAKIGLSVRPVKRYTAVWRPARQWRQTQFASPILRDWLVNRGSLTARLRSQGSLSVTLLSQQLQRLLPDERRYLVCGSQLVVVREVLLCVDQQPWVYARSLIPKALLQGPGRVLGQLGRTPLGEWLFAYPHIQRGPLQIARLYPDAPHYPSAQGQGQPLWARRSPFYIGQHLLLVCETFLPPLLTALELTNENLI